MLPSKRFWIQSFFAGLLALTGTAQNAPTDRDAVDPQTYVLRPNDVLLITVRPFSPSETRVRKSLGTSDMTVRVRVDGTIVLPTIPQVKVQGLTLAQSQTQLAKALSIGETDVTVMLNQQMNVPRLVRKNG